MKMESIAVLRWVPSSTIAEGEDAVVEVLEAALLEALHGNGLVAKGPFVVRPVRPGEYPQAEAAGPDGDAGAVLHLAEVAVE